jgi:type II secretory pathway component PulM
VIISVGEFREMPEARRVFRLFAVAAVLWAAVVFLLIRIGSMDEEISRRLGDGEQVIGAASVYRSYPVSSESAPARPGTNAFTIVTNVLDDLGIVGDRRSQLQQNPSGVQIKLDRLYGGELREFFTRVENQGLRFKAAEVKAMSVRDAGRLLYLEATFEQGEK